MPHFLSAEDFSPRLVYALFRLAGELRARQEPPKLLSGRSVALLFGEPSTRTRLSFSLAAMRLGAEVLTLDERLTSRAKGETLADTLEVLALLGVDVAVVRTSEDVIRPPALSPSVVSAGSGTGEHPTQALLDAWTLYEAFGRLEGLRLLVLGDLRHSRVFGSHARLLPRLGVRITAAAPRAWLGREEDLPGVAERVALEDVSLEDLLASADAVLVLRPQWERHAHSAGSSASPTPVSYLERYGLTEARARALRPESRILHPGPVTWGVEIDPSLREDPRILVRRQVENGLYVRMAVLVAAGGNLGPCEGDRVAGEGNADAEALGGDLPSYAESPVREEGNRAFTSPLHR
ncbi:aspartate/ornithine carbamoyltransferase family protein [Brockia lithotrophica]|uniref:Aspartate carbamoyltransferase n=1 Tax=Brockia lithotrophica TaxID=933949 RepID=A0A660L3M3_9BACL|nr:aspartate carbamoyltransferase [Brockia lithotrophica]RKQ88506.1 aspartate carbamoyltransferase [Brockia lithotrophica]